MNKVFEDLQYLIKHKELKDVKKYLAKERLSIDNVINEKNMTKETLLMFAIKNNKNDIAEYFLNEAKQPLDLYAQSYHFGTPLVCAVFFENLSLVKLLIEKEKNRKKHLLFKSTLACC